MPEDILYPIKARDEATPVFSQFLATLAGTDKATEKLKQRVDELSQRNEALTASLLKLEEEHGKYSAVLESATKGSQEWSEAQAKVIVLDERLAAVDKELGKNKAQLSQTQQKLTEATHAQTGAFQNLGTAIKNFAEAPLQTARHGIDALLASLGSTAVGLGAVAAGLATAAGAALHFASSTAHMARELTNLSAMTGMTTEQVQVLRMAGDEFGLSGETLTRTIAYLNQQLGRGEAGQFEKALQGIGISLRDEITGKVKSANDLLAEFSDYLRAIKDPVEQGQAAMAALGVRYREIIPLLVDTKESYRDVIESLAKYTISDKAVAQWTDLERALAKAKSGVAGLKNEIIDALGPMAEFAAFAAKFPGVGPAWQIEAWAKAAPLLLALARLPGGPLSTIPRIPARKPEELAGPPALLDYEERRVAEKERFERRVAAIAQGLKGEDLRLTLRLQEEEDKLKKIQEEASKRTIDGAEQKILAQAQMVAGVRDEIEAVKKAREEAKKQAEEQKRAFEDLDKQAAQYAARAEHYAYSLSLVIGPEMRAMWGRLADEIQKSDAGLKEFGTTARGMPSTAHQLKTIPNALEPTKGKLDDLGIGLSKTSERAKELGRQVSTIFTDLSRDIADNIVEWKGWGESILGIVKDFAKGMLRMFLEELFLPLERRMAGITGAILGGGGGAGGGGVTQFAQGGLGLFSSLFGGKGAFGIKASEVPDIGAIVSGSAPAAAGSFWKGAGGQAILAGGMIAGSMLWSDASKRGSALEGFAGGGLTGASIGTMIAPGIGTAIGAGIGAIAGFFTGLFGGAAKRRAEEAARRAAIQAQGLFSAPETIARTGAFGVTGETDIEADLTGRLRAIGARIGANITITVNNDFLDASGVEKVTSHLARAIGRAILSGGSQLADNVGYAAE